MTEPRRQPLEVLNPNDKVAQLRRELADKPSDPPRFLPHSLRTTPNAAHTTPLQLSIETQVVEALRTIFDPEIPLNIYDLGLIYEIDVDALGNVRVHMTLTAPGCPVAGSLVAEVERKVEVIAEVKSANVDLVWDPPWAKDMLSEEAKLTLGLF